MLATKREVFRVTHNIRDAEARDRYTCAGVDASADHGGVVIGGGTSNIKLRDGNVATTRSKSSQGSLHATRVISLNPISDTSRETAEVDKELP